ncbi:MAG TPA: tRNA dihydrouridine synthase DusB [Gammaproteobacteria bacterium]|nr:tRNA dihydrouridine synthase DusB [Gammaproteobacteria bacterium]
MRIGPYLLANPVALAPMAGVTDRPYRTLCRDLGAGLAVSEMVSAKALLWGSAKTRRRIDHRGEPEPRVVQIAGAEPAMMADAARFNVERGAQVIDINMGCPAKKVCRVMAGSALLRDEALVAEILNAVVRAVDVPVTLKFRTGWDRAHRNGPSVARIAEDAGIQALAVHGRTRACAYRGDAEYDTIAAIKEAVSIPVLANGDIDSPAKAREILDYTKADGVMIGRAALGRPWLPGQVAHFLNTGECRPDPTPAVVASLVVKHLEALYTFYGGRTGVLVARKHLAWYSKTYPGGAGFRRMISQAGTMEEQLAGVRRFFFERQQRSEFAGKHDCTTFSDLQSRFCGTPQTTLE